MKKVTLLGSSSGTISDHHKEIAFELGRLIVVFHSNLTFIAGEKRKNFFGTSMFF